MVEALGAWGVRWVGELGEQDLDPHLLMWDVRRTVPLESWPRRRTVLAFEFEDVASKVGRWWLCVSGEDVDICDYDPGFEVDATITTSLRTMTEIWRGDRPWSQALRAGLVTVDGPSAVSRDVPVWLGQSTLAAVPRPA